MNLDNIEQIVALIQEYPISEITVEQNGQKVHVRKSPGAFSAPSAAPHAVPVALAGTDAAETRATDSAVIAAVEDEPVLLTAPMVGLFHHPDPPARYGGRIEVGQVVGSIESMKLMNDVQADYGGQVIEILVEDGAPVEYGQPLFAVRPR